MKLLFCCEFYYPSVGGVQEVMRQIGEHLVARGHEVTVLTSELPQRVSLLHNGVKIQEFAIKGNLVRGMEGDINGYRDFVRRFECDAILIKAAQQWTFDALWPILNDIKARKVFIPCGFSSLYSANYKDYFRRMPAILLQFDSLIFYTSEYRDIDFAKAHACKNINIIPNGASEIEFQSISSTAFRERYRIPEDSFLLLTVGTLTGSKGHREVVEAFAKLNTQGCHATLILNGNPPPNILIEQAISKTTFGNIDFPEKVTKKFLGLAKKIKVKVIWFIDLPIKCIRILMNEGWDEVWRRLKQAYQRWFLNSGALGLKVWIKRISENPNKKLLLLDLPREELVEAYKEADLFVFASNIEYSPLVLFESSAAGTPFLSVPVGNAEEIAIWTQGGIICTASKNKLGYTYVSPKLLALKISEMMNSPEKLRELGANARLRWEMYFSWDKITDQYESILMGKTIEEPEFLRKQS